MKTFTLVIALFSFVFCVAQRNRLDESKGVYVDKQGVMRWVSNNEEAAFFGVNYALPFAYGYRSHKKMGIDIEDAIRLDVYHLSLIGVDAFRVHIWDTEISDVEGNLLDNDHLRLYDFLLSELKRRKIKTILTPIAFWGNGYPDPDEKTPGFSNKWPKRAALVNDTAIRAMENYLAQMMKHVNPYTKTTYQNDPDIIAAEINNEPHHSGPKDKVTEYVNRMVKSMRNNGWKKPIFYNISESPAYADAVSKANIQGVSFQWYPSGLVKNHMLGGNYLPHVDVYRIPFGDTIPQYRNKARMVYEFDAADIMNSTMYPAMARSYRTAGFQWATQFAYDPFYTAYANTEYQTHYLNLAYTPSKAISLLIASKIFHRVPRLQSYGSYPADTLFDVFRLSFENDLSEMNTNEEFYHTNSTQTIPKDISKLRSVAGVGNSSVVEYSGTGAYFLTKIADKLWRLEVMPDVVEFSDPFERTSLSKTVRRLVHQKNTFHLKLPEMGNEFWIGGPVGPIGNPFSNTIDGKFNVSPGVYHLMVNQDVKFKINLNTIVAVPGSKDSSVVVSHIPAVDRTQSYSFDIDMTIAGVDTSDRISLDVRHTAAPWQRFDTKKGSGNRYIWTVPQSMAVPGILTYRVIIQKANGAYLTFPGNVKDNPWVWDNAFRTQYWETRIVPAASPVMLFNAAKDRNRIMIYNPDWRSNTVQYPTSMTPGEVFVKTSMSNPGNGRFMAWQFYVGDNVKGRQRELPIYNNVVVKARAMGAEPATVHVTLITKDARAFSADIIADQNLKEISIPVASMKLDSMLLLPRPYPGFHPLYFKSSSNAPLDLKDIEKIEISFGKNAPFGTPLTLEVESIFLRRND